MTAGTWAGLRPRGQFGFFVDGLATGRDPDLARVRRALLWGVIT